MGTAAVGFIGYAVIFLVRNFTDSFLELGIEAQRGPGGQGRHPGVQPPADAIDHLRIAVSTTSP